MRKISNYKNENALRPQGVSILFSIIAINVFMLPFFIRAVTEFRYPASVGQVVRDLQDHILQFKPVFPFLPDAVVAADGAHDVPRHSAGGIAVSAVVYRGDQGPAALQPVLAYAVFAVAFENFPAPQKFDRISQRIPDGSAK